MEAAVERFGAAMGREGRCPAILPGPKGPPAPHLFFFFYVVVVVVVVVGGGGLGRVRVRGRVGGGQQEPKDVVSCNATISAFEKGKQWEGALYLLQGMVQQLLTPDVVSFHAAISECEKGKQWKGALGLLQEMVH